VFTVGPRGPDQAIESEMPVDHIRYDLLTQDALRSVIRTVLADAAVKGLPGEHHFFVTFDTRADGVRISPRLKASYPDEMTIVLQHQFWDLTVGDDDFEVGLAFNGVPERLHIPLRAVKAFLDPSVQFGLQFAVEAEAGKGDSGDDAPAADARTATAKSSGAKSAGVTSSAAASSAASTSPAGAPGPRSARKEAKQPTTPPEVAKSQPTALPKATSKAAAPKTPAAGSAPAKDEAGGEVVRFDRFRKK
jgi:uncharacterized protein